MCFNRSRLQAGTEDGDRKNRIIGLLGLLLATALLQACATVKIAYNQAPDLAYWYLDGYMDFDGAQSTQLRNDLAKLQTWHRQTELQGYIDALQKWQAKLPDELDAAHACEIFSDVRRKLVAVSGQAEPAAAALVGTLSAAQLAQLENKFSKINAEYREAYLEAAPKASRNKRYKQAVSRAHMLYGQLEEPQLAEIGLAIDQSRFDAALSYAEWQRRQRDALQTLRTIVALGPAAPNQRETTRVAVRGLFGRWLNSPDAGYRLYADALTQDSCKSFSRFHNSTSAAQRRHAVKTLVGYEQDLKALLAKN